MPSCSPSPPWRLSTPSVVETCPLPPLGSRMSEAYCLTGVIQVPILTPLTLMRMTASCSRRKSPTWQSTKFPFTVQPEPPASKVLTERICSPSGTVAWTSMSRAESGPSFLGVSLISLVSPR